MKTIALKEQIGILNSNMSELNRYLQDLTNRNSNQTNNT